MGVADIFLNLLFPKTCIGCGRLGSYFCQSCASQTKNRISAETLCPVCTKLSVGGVVHSRCGTRYSPDGLTAVFHYDGLVRKAVKLLKYRRVKDIADELADIIHINVSGDSRFTAFRHFTSHNIPVVTAVPLFRARERMRWFNQSEAIGRCLAKRWNVPFEPNILVKTRHTKPQAGLSREERMKNVKGAFELNPKYELPLGDTRGKRVANYENIILVDDVWTTGTTMRECTSMLKRAGVRKVWCLTVAR